jgi:hypothetical protein
VQLDEIQVFRADASLFIGFLGDQPAQDRFASYVMDENYLIAAGEGDSPSYQKA